MHGYYWDRVRLKNKLVEFAEGQFLMETKEGLVYRGEVRDFVIPDMAKKRLLINFSWLCEQHFGLDEVWRTRTKWVLKEPPISSALDVWFTFYYLQRKTDWERIKMWTSYGEICRFFKKGDPSNLKRQGDGEFLPCYRPPKSNLGPDD